jgi:hypothetical protein
MLRPGPAVPIERPPTVEEVIDEIRAPEGRSIDVANGALRHRHVGPDHCPNGLP